MCMKVQECGQMMNYVDSYQINVDYICTSTNFNREIKPKFYFGRRSFVSNLATPQEKTGFVYNFLIAFLSRKNRLFREAKLKK